MDINNILNHVDRHVVSQQSIPPSHHLPSIPSVITPPTYSIHPPSTQFQTMVPPPPPPLPPPLPNTHLSQPHHVYYSNPAVYHLPPPVEITSIQGLQYTYATLPTYDDPTSVEYVYQEYAEHPRYTSLPQSSIPHSTTSVTLPNHIIMSQHPPPLPPPLPPQLPPTFSTNTQTLSRPDDHDPLMSRFVQIDGKCHYRSRSISKSDPPKRARSIYKVENTQSSFYHHQHNDFSTINPNDEQIYHYNNISSQPLQSIPNEIEKETKLTQSRKVVKQKNISKELGKLESAPLKNSKIRNTSSPPSNQSIAYNQSTVTGQATLILENQSYGTEAQSDIDTEYKSNADNCKPKMKKHKNTNNSSKELQIHHNTPSLISHPQNHNQNLLLTNISKSNKNTHIHKSSITNSPKKVTSPTSIGDGSAHQHSSDVLSADVLDDTKVSTSSSDMNDILSRHDETNVNNKHDSTFTQPKPIVKKRKMKSKERKKESKKNRNQIIDPKEPYPQTFTSFSGIPPTAIGDMLQIWEFITAFSKTLKLSSFKLWHLEQAIVHSERSTLLDSCILRLVQTILSDEGLISDLGIPEDTVKLLSKKNNKGNADLVLSALPYILSFESDEVDDHFLHSTVQKLANSTKKLPFYQIINPAGRLRVLRELVDYAAMADRLRECVTDSMEHAEEEKKKVKEEHANTKKKWEGEMRDLRSELLSIKEKLGEKDSTNSNISKEKSTNEESSDEYAEESNNEEDDEKGEQLSRREKMKAAQKEKKEQEDRRTLEREADGITGKIERVRANLKSLKNIRLHVRGRDGDHSENTFTSSIPRLTEFPEDPVRTYPLGCDRLNRCYWFYEGSGKIWIEDTNQSSWTTICDLKNVDMLLKWLSPCRTEERALSRNVKSRLSHIEAEMAHERKEISKAEEEAKEAQNIDLGPRVTRSEKRKASAEGFRKPKKARTVMIFSDYKNLAR